MAWHEFALDIQHAIDTMARLRNTPEGKKATKSKTDPSLYTRIDQNPFDDDALRLHEAENPSGRIPRIRGQ